MQNPTRFLLLPASVCLWGLLACVAADAMAQNRAGERVSYKFNAYYADPVEASPSDLDVSPHHLADATDKTTSDRQSPRKVSNFGRSWKKYRSTAGVNSRFGNCNPYADVQLNFLGNNLTSKVDTTQSSDRLELSPRIVVGTRNCHQSGLRVRYQHYDWSAPSLSSPTPPGVQFELDTLDLEATKRLRGRQTFLELAAGVRFAKIEEAGLLGERDSDLIGGTIAADVQRCLCRNSGWNWSWVYGGRLSLLGGDYNGTVFASEIYTGLQCGCCCGSHHVFARFLFEVQNWHSDAFLLSDNVTLMGPGIQFGLRF